ncbi:hypothetical protein Vi05172_g503 [Venturia inaequalis]|nr:hypothetical protein Vi05172_g503 [Venturia inaequalis]
MVSISTTSVALFAALIHTISAFVVTGATGGIGASGERPFRLNIVGMAQSGGPAWDLYILATQRFQALDQKERLSYFQIAGVHGYPQIEWDGVKGTPNPRYPGYANHADIIFLTWHRAYLAAYEQILQQNAIQIANQYPQDTAEQYRDAATTLRIPYWDWASSAAMPDATTQLNITVKTPNGTQTIVNPLAAYRFRPVPSTNEFPPAGDFPFSQAPNTVRTPQTDFAAQTSAINSRLVSNANSLREKVYGLLARQTQFAAFATTAYPASLRNGSLDNIEEIHNQIHALVGGDGHMTFTAFSAFDPIFFIHHAQIDRLWAMWSAINPGSYVIPLKNDQGTFAQPTGTVEDINTPLLPFRSQGSEFHTSATVRDMKDFGYSYPEIVDWEVSATELASNVRTAVNRLYQRQTSLARRRSNVRRGSTKRRDWYINFQGLRQTTTAFAINFFLEEPPAAPQDWATAPNLIVSQIVLADNSIDKVAPQAISQIPLSFSLELAMASGKLNGTDTDSVTAYLENNLLWTASFLNGDGCEPGALDGLDVSVVDQEVVESARMDQFHSYGKYNLHPELSYKRTESVQSGRGGRPGSRIMSFSGCSAGRGRR